jgi:hypothetical protein
MEPVAGSMLDLKGARAYSDWSSPFLSGDQRQLSEHERDDIRGEAKQVRGVTSRQEKLGLVRA